MKVSRYLTTFFISSVRLVVKGLAEALPVV